MFLSETEVEKKLEELRRQRDNLDRLIADHLLYLELGRRLPSSVRPATEPAEAVPETRTDATVGSGTDVSGLFQGLSDARRNGRAMIAAAIDALRRAGRPLHVSEILDHLKPQGFILAGADPVAALNTRLWKRSGPNGPLRRLGDAVYALADGDGDTD